MALPLRPQAQPSSDGRSKTHSGMTERQDPHTALSPVAEEDAGVEHEAGMEGNLGEPSFGDNDIDLAAQQTTHRPQATGSIPLPGFSSTSSTHEEDDRGPRDKRISELEESLRLAHQQLNEKDKQLFERQLMQTEATAKTIPREQDNDRRSYETQISKRDSEIERLAARIDSLEKKLAERKEVVASMPDDAVEAVKLLGENNSLHARTVDNKLRADPATSEATGRWLKLL